MNIFSQKFYYFSFYNKKQIRGFADLVRDEGGDPNLVLNLRPDASHDPLEFVRQIPEAELPFIVPDAFAGSLGEEMLAEMSVQQLEVVGQKGDFFLKEAVKRAARKAMLKGKPISRIKEYLDFSPAWQTNPLE